LAQVWPLYLLTAAVRLATPFPGDGGCGGSSAAFCAEHAQYVLSLLNASVSM